MRKQQQILDKSAVAAIRAILVNDWDPIGVMDDPEWPRDEYDLYIGELYGFIQRGESVEFVARHLCFIEEAQIGLGSPPVSTRIGVAERLLALRELFSSDAKPQHLSGECDA